MYIPHFVYLYLLLDIWVHLLAVMNNDAMNMCVQIFVGVPALNSFECIPRIGIAGSYGKSVFNFLKNHHTVFLSGCELFYIPTSNAQGSNFFTFLPTLVIFVFLFLFCFLSNVVKCSYPHYSWILYL